MANVVITDQWLNGWGSVSTLYDDFAGPSIDATKWWYSAGGASISAGQLHLPITTGGAVQSNWVDLHSSSASIEVVQVGANAASTCYFYAYYASANSFGFIITNGLLECWRRVGSSTYTPTYPYDPVAHRFLRLRESGGTIYWETSPDGVTWSVAKSGVNPWGGTLFEFNMTGGSSTDQDFIVDNFNVFNISLTGVAGAALSAAPVPTSVVGIQNVTLSAVAARATATAPIPTALTIIQNSTLVSFPGLAVAAAPIPGLINARAPPSAGATSTAPVPTVVAVQNITLSAVAAGATATAAPPTVLAVQNVTASVSTGLGSFALVGSAGAAQASASGADLTTLTWGTSETRTAGNTLVCFVDGQGSATLPSAPTGWFIAAQKAGVNCSTSIFYRTASGSDAAPTITGVPSAILQGLLAEFSGLMPLPLDQIGTAAGTSTPVVATAGAHDVSTGELYLYAGVANYSVAAAVTLTPTHTNVTGAVNIGQNAVTSTTNHYQFGYGRTNFAGTPDADSWAITTTNLNGAAVAIATFKLVGVGGGVALAPPPTISIGVDLTVTAVAASALSTAPNPTPQVTLAPSSAAGSATAPVSTVLAVQNVTLSAVAASASATAPIPTVVATRSVTLSAVAASGVAAAPVPVPKVTLAPASAGVTASASVPVVLVTIAASAASASATAPVPTVRIDEAEAGIAASATATAPVPTLLATRNPTILAVTASATASAPPSTLRLDESVTGVSAGVSATAPVPAIRLDTTVTAVSAGAIAGAPISSLQIGSGITVTAPSAGVSATAPIPAISESVNATVTAVAATVTSAASAPTLTLTSSVSLSAPSAGASATAPAPSRSISSTVLASAAQAHAAGSAPSIGITLVVPAAQVSTSAPAPTVQAVINATIPAVAAQARATAVAPTVDIESDQFLSFVTVSDRAAYDLGIYDHELSDDNTNTQTSPMATTYDHALYLVKLSDDVGFLLNTWDE